MFKKDHKKEEKINTENLDIDIENMENPFVQKNEDQGSEKEYETIEISDIISEEQKLKNEIETLNNQYVRLAADFDNYRKRQAQERESLLKYGAEDTLKKLLPILDTFDRAKKSMTELNEPEKIKECFDVLNKQFVESLEKLGLEKIETEGKEFNPNIHEAVMQTPTNDHPDQFIVAELQSGYKLAERVLRPAMVNVAVSE